MTTEVSTLIPLAERPLHERVAAVIRGAMAQYDVTQARIGALLGITQQSVSRKRSGHTPYTLDELEVIAPLFGMEPDEILAAARQLRPVDPNGPGWAPRGSNPQPAVYTSPQVSENVVPLFRGPEPEPAPVDERPVADVLPLVRKVAGA